MVSIEVNKTFVELRYRMTTVEKNSMIPALFIPITTRPIQRRYSSVSWGSKNAILQRREDTI